MAKIFAVRLNEVAKVEEMELTLDNMHNFVGGYVECVRLNNNVDLWLNEEGKLEDLQPNIVLLSNGVACDYVCGNVFFCSSNEEGESIGLNEEQIAYINERLKIGVNGRGERIYTLEMR